jgi:hypothetical protein
LQWGGRKTSAAEALSRGGGRGYVVKGHVRKVLNFGHPRFDFGGNGGVDFPRFFKNGANGLRDLWRGHGVALISFKRLFATRRGWPIKKIFFEFRAEEIIKA